MKYAVVGAGWAGCSAAVELTKAGHQVHLFEAARTLGGRARQVVVHDLVLDNGQHIFSGAYQATLALLRSVGQQQHLLRLPLQICYPGSSAGMQLIAQKLPAPFHMLAGLIRAQGLNRADKMALLRFSSTARWMDWQLNADCTVEELLLRFDQTENLIRLMWQPLCVAALNTPASRASAQIFLNVLKDSLGAKRSASDMLIPTTDLSSLLPQAAAAYVTARGGAIHVGRAVQAISQHQMQWRLDTAQASDHFDGIVLATPPEAARHLLAPLNLAAHIPEFQYEPITTCYLKYPDTVRLERPFLALLENPAHAEWGQFVFDRGQTGGVGGLLAVVISASHQAIEHGHAELALHCAKQLTVNLGRPELRTPEWSQVITEKRATFACTPNLRRPANLLAATNLVLAGDYTESRYPATLEAAVQSGVIAAKILAGRRI